MKRNRRKVEGEVTFGWIVTRLLLFMLLVSFLLGVTFLKHHNLKLNEDWQKLDEQLAVEIKKTQQLESRLAALKTPKMLKRQMEAFHIVMVQPTEAQIRRLPDPTVHSDIKTTRSRMIAQTEMVHSTVSSRAH